MAAVGRAGAFHRIEHASLVFPSHSGCTSRDERLQHWKNDAAQDSASARLKLKQSRAERLRSATGSEAVGSAATTSRHPMPACSTRPACSTPPAARARRSGGVRGFGSNGPANCATLYHAMTDERLESICKKTHRSIRSSCSCVLIRFEKTQHIASGAGVTEPSLAIDGTELNLPWR